MESFIPTDPNQFLGQLVTAIIDRPLGSQHPIWHFLYPINYGFVSGTISSDGEAMDVYILGIHQPLSRFTGQCIAVIYRKEDPGDPKLVLTPLGVDFSDEDILTQVDFQEKFFESVIQRVEN